MCPLDGGMLGSDIDSSFQGSFMSRYEASGCYGPARLSCFWAYCAPICAPNQVITPARSSPLYTARHGSPRIVPLGGPLAHSRAPDHSIAQRGPTPCHGRMAMPNGSPLHPPSPLGVPPGAGQHGPRRCLQPRSSRRTSPSMTPYFRRPRMPPTFSRYRTS